MMIDFHAWSHGQSAYELYHRKCEMRIFKALRLETYPLL